MNKELLQRFFRCETEPTQEKQLMDWLDVGDENRRLFEAERAIFEALAVHAPGISQNRRLFKKRLLRRIAATAAAAAAMVAIALGTGRFMRADLERELSSMAATISVPVGQRLNMTLPDGTRVWLNSDTRLQYPPVFGKQRRVKISGEAMFDVEHDPQRPFIVETFIGELEVLGTRFNVEADERTGIFEASLIEGRLKVTNKLNPGEEFIMMPDNVLSYTDNRLVLKMGAGSNEFLWTEGIISFENVAFDELMKQFEKYFDVTIRIERQTLPKINYTRGKIRIMDGVDHAIKALQYASDFTYYKDEENRLIIIK